VPCVRRAGADDVVSAIRRAACIQLDSVSAVERRHRIAIASRAGIYPRGLVSKLLRDGRVIEPGAVPRAGRACARGDPRARGGRLAGLRRQEGSAPAPGGDDVELEAGEAGARRALRGRVTGDRRSPLERLAVKDGRAPVLVEPGIELDRPRPSAAVLLSPFDNLLWETRFGQRVLGFENVIELYKPAPQRRYGYYVLPFLCHDRIVGRADLKSERRDRSLVVKAFHLEPGVRRTSALDGAFDRALERLRRTEGLECVTPMPAGAAGEGSRVRR
jgi:uncharacterized protein YcaQ